MLAHLPPSSALSIGLLAICLLLVLAFEATNGFHDAANAVATVIYTNSLKSVPAVVWSRIMNFISVIVGGISVAYALVELLPPDVLSPPDGSPAVPMLVSLFISACFWNLATWYFGIPNSSSHCIIGALVGVAIAMRCCWPAGSVMASIGAKFGKSWRRSLCPRCSALCSPVASIFWRVMSYAIAIYTNRRRTANRLRSGSAGC